MKICWDNLEEITYDKKKERFRYKGHLKHYHDKCLGCGDPFLGGPNNKYCDGFCSNGGEKNPRFGDHRNWVEIHGEDYTHPRKGVKFSETHIQNIKESRIKSGCAAGEKNPNYKGGYHSKNIARYDLFAPQLEPYGEECRRNAEDSNILEVKCTYCGKWHKPRIADVKNRIAIGIRSNDTHRLYCSPECKQECPIYKKVKYSTDHPKSKKQHTFATEVPPEFRQMVFERDNHTCQRCGSTKSLQCHHIVPKKLSPMEAVDLSNGITFCKECHKWVHMNIPGCGYGELASCT
ncbi:MAG: HNH endonuclease [Candidatus Shapirobacteria bacterium]